MLKLPPGKSGTREVAVALLLLWAFASAYLFFWITSSQVQDYREVYATLTTACVGFAFGAFGLTKVVDSGAFGKSAPRRKNKAELL